MATVAVLVFALREDESKRVERKVHEGFAELGQPDARVSCEALSRNRWRCTAKAGVASDDPSGKASGPDARVNLPIVGVQSVVVDGDYPEISVIK